jgi:hypothetical protein
MRSPIHSHPHHHNPCRGDSRIAPTIATQKPIN